MRKNIVKSIALGATFGILAAVGSVAQAAVVVVREPVKAVSCTYSKGYAVCYVRGGYQKYYASSSRKVCTPHLGCHWEYCYRPMGPYAGGCYPYGGRVY